MTLQQLQQTWVQLAVRYVDEYKQLRAKIEQRHKQIHRLETKLKNLKHPNWTEVLLTPIVTEFTKRHPEYQHDGKLYTFGIYCRCPLMFYRNPNLEHDLKYNDDNCISITIMPASLPILHYETGEEAKRYSHGTLGAINGGNNVTKELESIEEAIQYLEKQITAR